MAHLWRPDRWDLGAIVLLISVTLLFCWPTITPDLARRASFPDGDFYDQFYAFARYEHARLWAGQVPLWNPHTFGGHPFLADVQAAVFYPPSLLVMLLSGPDELSPQWLILEAIAHIFLGALFTYLFVRRLTGSFGTATSACAGVLSALTFAFGGYLTSYPPLQLAILETQVWLPLILLLLEIGFSTGRWAPLVVAGMVWGVSLLAGHPQSAMYVMYCALAYGVFCAFRSRRAWTWCLAAIAVWILIGVGTAAVHVLPAWEFMRLSVRAGLSYEELQGGFAVRDLVQAILPGVLTLWSPVYVGINALLMAGLAGLGAFSSRDRQSLRAAVVFWGLLVLVAVLLSLGGETFLYPLFYRVVPGFNLFRSQERAVFVASFGLAVLAGYGWAWVSSIDGEVSWVRRARLGALALGLLATGTVVALLVLAWNDSVPVDRTWLAAAVRWLGLSWAGWALLWWTRGRRFWWPALSILLVVVDLLVVNRTIDFAPGPADAHVPDDGWLAPVTETEGLFRIVNDFGLPGNAGCWFDLEDMAGISPLRLQAHKVMSDALPRWRMWQLFDVRYVATWEHDLPGPFSSTRVAMQGTEWAKDTVYVHRIEQDLPRAWIVHRVQEASDIDALQIMSGAEFDPFDTVLLAAPVPAQHQPSLPTQPSIVRAVAHAPEQIAVWSELSAPGWLVLGEWDYPGWRAWVDGRAQTIYRADYGLRAVPLTAGAHHIVFRYRPVSVYVGGAISVLTLSVSLALVVAGLSRQNAE